MNTPVYPVGPQAGAPAQRNLGQLIANLGPQSELAKTSTVDPRGLAAGIKPSFASINFKGKTWGIRYRGVTQQLLVRGQQGEILGAVPTIDVVIVKSASAISKAFYIDKYREGSFQPPDCWSTNGQVPDIAAAKRQSETCRGCRWDAFGSRTMDDGRKGKACSDNKRVAVVPATDLKNEAFGGPMLLKLTPSGFNGLSELENQLHMQGYVYWGVVMRLSFDYEQAFPKIIFTPVRVLNDHEQQEVLNLQSNDTVDRILSEELFEVTADPNQPTNDTTTTPVVTPEVSVRPVTPVTPVTPLTQAFDPGPLPQGLVRTPPPAVIPMGGPTPEQQRIADLEAQLAAARAPAPPPPPPKPVLTPEQQKIADLEAQLAAARGGASTATTATTAPAKAPSQRKAKTRTQPVTPAATPTNAMGALPGDQPLPFQSTTAAPATPAGPSGNGAATEVSDTAQENGDAPPDLDSRIDSLLGNKPAS